ncbi:acyl-CoA N-acyltransferase [Xylariaceae sp. FL1019]|nr:acyl-CoA N-acyltransferase [Xylariaceae sp. FL1019]
MSIPSSNANANANANANPNGQSSIRSFFRPKQPTYAPPPSSTTSFQAKEPLPPPPTRPFAGATAISKPAPPATTAATTAISSSTLSPLPRPNISSSPPRPPDLHPQATIVRIQADHIPALRRITSLLLPVNYPDSFYARLQDPLSSGAFSRVVLWREDDNPSSPPKVVGGLVCRPEPSQFPPRGGPIAPQPNALYIQSLVLLSPYRSLGLAAALLEAVVQDAKTSHFACETAWAHVWSPNEEGLRWYMARGFHKVEEVKGYYFKLRPDSAWIVRRDMDLVGNCVAQPSSTHTTHSVSGSVTAAAANLATGRSYQKVGPATEWNDLPPDMAPLSMASSGSKNGNGDSNLQVPLSRSNTSSRSSSAARSKKKDRAYPAAAFGN